MVSLVTCLLAVAATATAALLLIPVARLSGWMDYPDTRKVHVQPTPLVGGLAIFTVFFAVAGFYNYPGSSQYWSFLSASGLVLVLGGIDDRWPLSARVRFSGQIVAALLMIYGAGVMLNDYGQLFWSYTLGLGVLAVPLTVFSALGVINAFNMIDGVDGLSGRVYLTAASGMVALALVGGQMERMDYVLLSAACVLGFLLLNARFPWNAKARTFLGDSGSGLLGFWLAWFFIELGNGDDRVFAPITAVWLIGLPLLDTTRLMRNRWRQGRSAFEADQYHLHHAFLKAGFSAVQCWLGVTLMASVLVTVGVVMALAGVPEYVAFYAFIGTALCYFAWMKRVWQHERFLGRNFAILADKSLTDTDGAAP